MTKDEALKLALEALEKISKTEYHIETPPIESLEEKMRRIAYKAITAIKEALAQPEQEPVANEAIWLLTSEYNDYDQHGEYFEAVFIGKPTSKQIQKHCHVTEQGAVHILNGGGRVKYEDQWYNLRKEKTAHGIKGLA